MKKAFFLLFPLFGAATPARALSDASSIILKVFEMRASRNTDCSDPVMIFKTDNPTPVDLMNNPLLGSGALPNGTYHCLMFKVGDILTVVPKSSEGSCIAGTTYDMDIFNDPFLDVSFSPENTQIIAHNGIEDRPWIYFSDSHEASGANNCFEKNLNGCACSGPCTMTPLIETADQRHSLVVNLDQKVDGSGAACALLQPVMSIR